MSELYLLNVFLQLSCLFVYMASDCDCRQSGSAGAAGTDLVEGSTATSSLSFGGTAADSGNVLGLLQRDSSRYPELYSGMLQHQQQLSGMLLYLHVAY